MAGITCSDGLHLSVEDIIRRDAVINDDGTITIVSAARTIKIHRTTADTTPTASA